MFNNNIMSVCFIHVSVFFSSFSFSRFVSFFLLVFFSVYSSCLIMCVCVFFLSETMGLSSIGRTWRGNDRRF
jgi:hypothetical protein